MDVKTVFLHGFVKKELYMMQPEGFVNPKGANKVDELTKAYSFIQTCGEACIYKNVSGSTTTFLISICE